MKRGLLILCLVLLYAGARSQDYSTTFGHLGTKEKSMTTYPLDPDAEALVLMDIGEASFRDTDEGFDIRFERTRRVKILTEAGLDHAEVVIPLYMGNDGKKEKLQSLEAYSYMVVNGVWQRFEVEATSVFEEKLSKYYMAKKFTFPRVGPGTIIEYRAVVISPYIFNLPDWEFQDRIPVRYSSYTVKMIPFYEYMYIAQGINKFSSQNSYVDSEKRVWGTVNQGYSGGSGFEYNDMVNTFVMKNVPAFRDESYITSREDFIMKIDFQLSRINQPNGTKEDIVTTWEELIEDNLKYEGFGKYIKKSKPEAGKYLKAHPELMELDKEERSRKLIEYVKNSFDWNGYYGKYSTLSPKAFVSQKQGNSAEMNLYMLALLRAAGIEADALMISTRDHGKVDPGYPFEHFLNHVIIRVGDDKDHYLADATSRLLAYNRIPPRCINDRGLLVREGPVTWINLRQKEYSREYFELEIIPDPVMAEAKVSLSVSADEYEAYAYRNGFKDDRDDLKEYFNNKGFSAISELETRNYRLTTAPYEIQMDGSADIGLIEEQLIIHPFLDLPEQKNPFTESKRSYPVDMIYARSHNFKSTIRIPEGYKVVHLPEDFKAENKMIRIEISYRIEGGILVAEGNYTYKKAVYTSKEYPLLRHYRTEIIRRFNEPVLLEK